MGLRFRPEKRAKQMMNVTVRAATRTKSMYSVSQKSTPFLRLFAYFHLG